MKLPGIQYDRPVQRLVTASPQAVAASITAVPDALKGIADEFYKQEASAQYNKLWADAQGQLNIAEISLTENPYEKDEETGELVSRHSSLMGSYGETEKAIKESILSKAGNKMARDRLAQSFTERKVRADAGMAETASTWNAANSHRMIVQSIDQNLEMGRYDDAEKAFISGAAAGAFSNAEIEAYPGKILQHQQYGQLSAGVNLAARAEDFNAARNDISANNAISGVQRKGLHAELGQKIEDSLVTSLRGVVETRGIVMGEKAIRIFNKTPHDELGYDSEEGKFQAISRMQSVLEDYRFGLKQGRDQLNLQDRIDCIRNGCPADPKSKIDKKAMSAVFDEFITKEDGTKEEPFSERYMQAAGQLANIQGWVPEDVKTDVRAYLQHTNPANVVKGSGALLELDTIAPRSVLEFDRKDISFALTINDYASRGVAELETIAKIREGIYRVPNALRKGREDTFNKVVKRESVKILKDLVASDDAANPWLEMSAEFPDDMRLEFEAVFKDEYVISGNEKVAAQAAYRTMRNIWGVSDRGDGLTMERNSPEAIYGGGKPVPALTEQFNLDMESIGLNPEKVGLELDPSAPEAKRWIVFDKETNDVKVNSDGTIMMWQYDYETSPAAERQRKEATKAREGAEWRMNRDREIEAGGQGNLRQFYGADELDIPLPMQGTAGLLGFGEGESINPADAAHNAAVDAWEFVLKDTPEWWDSWSMPHKRKWAKEARGE